MSIVVTEQRAKASVHLVALGVKQSGMKVTVEAGKFRLAGVPYEFSEAQDFVATADPDNDTLVTGYLVEEVATRSPALVVDEEVLDGKDVPYNFIGSPYKLLHRLYHFRVPAAVSDLDAVDISVFHVALGEEK